MVYRVITLVVGATVTTTAGAVDAPDTSVIGAGVTVEVTVSTEVTVTVDVAANTVLVTVGHSAVFVSVVVTVA